MINCREIRHRARIQGKDKMQICDLGKQRWRECENDMFVFGVESGGRGVDQVECFDVTTVGVNSAEL